MQEELTALLSKYGLVGVVVVLHDCIQRQAEDLRAQGDELDELEVKKLTSIARAVLNALNAPP